MNKSLPRNFKTDLKSILNIRTNQKISEILKNYHEEDLDCLKKQLINFRTLMKRR